MEPVPHPLGVRIDSRERKLHDENAFRVVSVELCSDNDTNRFWLEFHNVISHCLAPHDTNPDTLIRVISLSTA